MFHLVDASPLHLALAAALALTGVAVLAQLWWGQLHIPSLADVPPRRAGGPRVSVIIAARNEERHIEAAVRALLAQSYPDLEVVAVDDRSTDGTAEILRRAAARDARLSTIHLDAVPDGWLGKNHALHRGAAVATGDLLLFADADVILDADAIARAVRLVELERADHLAVAPNLEVPTWSLALVVNYFMMWFLLYLRPWKAQDPRSRAFIGIGAFNLVSTSAYRAIDGHTRIALRPDDDIMLGKLLKQAGYRQLLATADGIATVEWYRSLGEMAHGFRKNAFAGLHYSLALVAGTVVMNLAFAVWPFIAMWTVDGLTGTLYAVAAISQVVAYFGSPLVRAQRPWLAVLYPLAALAFTWIVTAAVARTVRRGGIEWRETFYSLSRLKANRV